MADAARPVWVDDELFPFESRFVTIDGHIVHYVDEGSGPTLLLLHGNPTWSFVHREVIRALRDEFRCVALDYPGFGLSSARPGYRYRPEDHAEVVTAFVDALSLSGVTLVAHDWGGPIGLATAEQRPAAFEGLVLVNTWGWPTSGDSHFEIFSYVMGGPLGRLLIKRFNLFVNAFIPTGHRLRKPTADEMTHYRKALATLDRREAAAVLPRRITASRAFLGDVEAGLPNLASLPTLILWGGADFPSGPRSASDGSRSSPATTPSSSKAPATSCSPTPPTGSRRRSATGGSRPADDAHPRLAGTSSGKRQEGRSGLRRAPGRPCPGTAGGKLASGVRTDDVRRTRLPRHRQDSSGGKQSRWPLARVDPASADLLLATTNARPMEMKGRAIQGWLHVDGDDLHTEHQLAQWIALGTATARCAPARRPNR